MVSRKELEDYNSKQLTREDIIANRFAAEFLVPKAVLINELDIRGIEKDNIDLSHVVVLMDVFIVPYKTMVRRLYEIEFISKQKCIEFLQIEDRDKKKGVMLMQKRLKTCLRNNERTQQIKFDNLQDFALKLYEKGLITKERLKYYLELEGNELSEFEMSEESVYLPSEEEVLLAIED